MGNKAAEITQNINNVFDPRLLINIHYSGGWGSFAKETRDLKMKSTVARHWKLTMTNWEPLSKLILLTAIQEVAQEFNVNHSMVIQHLKQIGKVKKLNKWVPCELITSQRNHQFEVSSSLTLTTINHFSIGLDCDMWWKVDFIWQLVMTNSVRGSRKHSKALPKAKLVPKNIMVTVWWSATCLIHYSFLNPGKTSTYEKYTQQINERHPKLQCLQPALVNRKGPILHSNVWHHIAQPTLQKLNELGHKVLPHPHIHLTSHQLTASTSSISTTFCRENASTTNRR